MYDAVPLQLSLCHQYGDNVVNAIFEGTTKQIYLIARIINMCVCVCVYIYIMGMYLPTSLSMNLFYKYLKTKILNFFVEIRLRLIITCTRNVKVHRASLLKWQSCDLLWKCLVEFSAGYWPVGLRFLHSQLLDGNSEIL
jgi:hypothetical protein